MCEGDHDTDFSCAMHTNGMGIITPVKWKYDVDLLPFLVKFFGVLFHNSQPIPLIVLVTQFILPTCANKNHKNEKVQTWNQDEASFKST